MTKDSHVFPRETDLQNMVAIECLENMFFPVANLEIVERVFTKTRSDMIFVKTFTLVDFAKFKSLPKESA